MQQTKAHGILTSFRVSGESKKMYYLKEEYNASQVSGLFQMKII